MPAKKSGAAKKKAKAAKEAETNKKQRLDPAVAAASGQGADAIEHGKDTEGKGYGTIQELWKAELGAAITPAAVSAVVAATPQQLADALKAKQPAATAAPAAAAAAPAAGAAAAGAGAAVLAAVAGDAKPKEEELRKTWYDKGAAYWAKTPATVDGVLGGFGHVSPIDVTQSKEFLATLGHGKSYALDCGAGIGRVSKELLLPLFGVVDLVEQNPAYVAKARELIVDKRLANFYVCGLQHFTPVAGRYDVIWVQWVLGHLPDDDFVAFFKRCKLGLKPKGFICVKENALHEGFLYDKDDDSVMRSDAMLRELFSKAGLSLVATRLQKKFPKELYPVRMYAFKPVEVVQAEEAAAAAAAATAKPAAAAAAAAAASN